ncbi:MAG: hypothetical protein ABI333_01295 [bacterium]
MSGDWADRHGPAQRLGGTLLVLGVWLGIGWLVWLLAWPGPTPELTLDSPQLARLLPLDQPVHVTGTSRHTRRLRCEGRDVTPGPDGRFDYHAPGPTRPGLYVLRCVAENARGRNFPFPQARLAGASRPLTDTIEDAVVVVLPLAALQAQGGLLHGLSRLVTTRLATHVMAAAEALTFQWGGLRLGPIHIGGLTLLGIEAAGRNRLALTLGLQDLSIGLHLPDGWVPDRAPAALRTLLLLLGSQRKLTLPGTLPITVRLHWPVGGRPSLALGRLSTHHVHKALPFKFLADTAAAFSALLSGKLHEQLAKALRSAGGLTQQLERVFAQVQRRLGRLSGLIPPLPKAISPGRIAACLAFRLSHITTSQRTKVVRFHLSATVQGYAEGRRCTEPAAIRPIPLRGVIPWRLSLGPPAPVDDQAGPSLVVAHDLINAYLATVWASGGLDHVPFRLPATKQAGFDIRSLRYHLPPVVTTAAGRLRLEVGELGVRLHTVGEPRRLFAAHLRLAVAVAVHKQGRIRFQVPRTAPPELHVRCEQEAGGACAAQSRRFQSLVNIGTELAFRPELAGPALSMEAALPTLRGPGVNLDVRGVRVVPRGVVIQLGVRQRGVRQRGVR